MTTTTMSTILLSAIRAWIVGFLLLFSGLVIASPANAHPEDEFCTPDGGLDPELCRALRDLDRAGPVVSRLPDGQALPELEINRPWLETLRLYLEIGVGHILPGGTDHILFVLALVLSTRRVRSLVLQISAFTLAHTLTLGLAAADVISPPSSVVEPLIALTIALVAVEVMIFREPPKWRLPVVVLFGLIHGMGFAGFFSSLGLPEGQFLSALAGFNIGVEIGQLAVAITAAILLWLAMRALQYADKEQVYRPAVIIPASLVVSAIGAFWFVERVAGTLV